MRPRTSRLPLRRPCGRSLLVVLLLLPPIAACGRSGRSDAPWTADLHTVAPPPDLARLDLAVRDQFDRVQRRLRELEGDSEDAGSAWGGLGQWFDIYGYDQSARRCYRNAQRLQPGEPRWPYFLGKLAEERGRLDDAVSKYRRAAELAPDVAAPNVRLGDVALRRQDLELAERLFRQVLRSHPGDPGALLGSARLALARDEPGAALAPLRRLTRRQPEAVEVNYTLGLAWRRLGDERQAEEYLSRVPEDNGDQVPLDSGALWDRELQGFDVGARTLTRRGVRAFRRGEHERAAVLLGRAVAADPEGAEKRINYALALREIGRWRAAAEELRAALDRAEEGSELAAKAHLETGRLLVDRGRPVAAVPHLEASLAIDPDSAPAHVALGRLLHRRGDLEGALSHYAAVRGQKDDAAGVRFWYAALLLALDRGRDAFEALGEDVHAARDARDSRLLLARLLSTAAATDLSDVSRARRLLAGSGPADVLFAESAAMVAAAESRFAEASAWQQTAIDRLADLPARTAVHTARRRLVLYERGEPCCRPWEAGERLVRAPVHVPANQTLLVDGSDDEEVASSP